MCLLIRETNLYKYQSVTHIAKVKYFITYIYIYSKKIIYDKSKIKKIKVKF